MELRNSLYDGHVLRSHKVAVATVCIGNLAVGGTGKTPHTELLARELSKHFRVAILSRGYKRKTHGFQLADHSSTAFTIGDEPMQMHLNLPDITIAVCEDRVRGINRLLQLFPKLDVVILDDAFQHRKLSSGFNILLTAADNLYVNDHFLPYGSLRDSRRSALRANMIIVSKCKAGMQPIERRVIETAIRPYQYQRLFFSSFRYSNLQPISNHYTLPEQAEMTRPLLLTGIANPTSMINYLKSIYTDVQSIGFADHHYYNKSDFLKLEKLMHDTKSDFIITTQKDAVRLLAADIPEHLAKITAVLPVEVDFGNCLQDVCRPIIQYITENKRNR